MLRNLFCVVFAGLMMAACGSSLPLKDIPSGATLGVADPVKPEIGHDYHLSPGDIVQIEVVDVPTLNRTAQLDAQGMITMPYLGLVPAAGKTATELTMELQNRYGEKYLKNPEISVAVKQARVDTFVVDGSVTAPGVFPVGEKTTLIRALAQAKGLDNLANPKGIVVFRVINNQRVAGVFDLNEIRAGKQPDPPIYPNDTIVVASSGARRTLKDVVGFTPLVGLLSFIP